MTRFWTEGLDTVDQVVPLSLLVILLLGAAAVVGLLWYFYPRWVPRRLPRFRMPRWRLRWPGWPRWRGWRFRWRWPDWLRFRWRWPDWLRWRRKRKPDDGPEQAIDELESGGDELPDLPAEVFVSLADRLAAEGRYAEAVRERLRAIVRELVDRGAIEHHPGWTVTEIARGAAAARPAVGPPLTEATGIFSEIWYGQRPAFASHDARMRTLAEQVTAAERVPA